MLRSKSICNKISFFFHSYFLFSKLWIICKRPKVNMGWYKELQDKSPYINIDVHVFQMKTANIESVANRKSHRWYANIPMDVFAMINVVTTQRHIVYADIIMDISTTANVITTQFRRCHASISMDIFAILYVVTTQRRWYCAGIPMDEDRNMNALMCNAVGIVPIFQWTHLSPRMFSSRNSVRVVLLIARGWRGTSLPRVNVRKEIQRHRCWAFSKKAWV